MICSILILKIKDIESKNKKYELIYCPSRKPLLLENLVLYVYRDSEKDGKAINIKIPKKEVQLCLGTYVIKSLCVALVKLSKSWFPASSGLSNFKHIYHHVCTIISMKKDISFFLVSID